MTDWIDRVIKEHEAKIKKKRTERELQRAKKYVGKLLAKLPKEVKEIIPAKIPGAF